MHAHTRTHARLQGCAPVPAAAAPSALAAGRVQPRRESAVAALHEAAVHSLLLGRQRSQVLLPLRRGGAQSVV